MALPENSQSFIDEDPKQPAAKRALVFEAWRIPRGPQPAVVDSGVGLFRTAENATRNEVQQSVAPAESGMKYVGVLDEHVCDWQVFFHRSPNIKYGWAGALRTCTCPRSSGTKRGSCLRGPLQWQRDGRRENAVGIETSLQLLQSGGVSAVSVSCLFVIGRSQHVGIASR
jgi:hypothetical protein